jgi:alpha-L-rhamnosidase
MTYDLTDALKKPGQHTLGAVIADGWCCGNLTIFRYRNHYHSHPELLARLELTYEDGATQAIVTDGSWKVTTGPIISADLYDGENYDARLEMPGWNTNGYDVSKWWDAAVGEKAAASPLLVQKMAPPVRVVAEIKPVKLLNPAKDVYIWDFGQNFTGKFRIRNFSGVHGRLYTFKMAEMLNEHGELYNLNYRSARSEDSYICPGPFEKKLEYTPTFTFHGLRYLQIFGFQLDELKAEELEVTGLVMHSDMDIKSSFECGDKLVSRLWLNTLWGHRGNYLEIPTDCPQRDERMGWTGDSQVFSATAMFNMDCCAFLRKYLRDIRDGQKPEGASPSIAPAILDMAAGAGAWGDAIAIIPFNLYRHFGWKNILAENFEAMKKSVLWQKEHSENLIRCLGSQYGDWLASEPTDKYLVATAYFGRCARIVAETAAILGAVKDAKTFGKLADDIAKAFRQKYTNKKGLVSPGTQCGYCLAIEFGLLQEKDIAANVKALAADIKKHGGKMTTGFLGTPIILDALAKHGYPELACDLVLQKEYPSWLFSVLQGATTMWERWNSYTVKDGFGSVAMNSFNHYAYGVVAKFMLEELGGIHYDKDGLRLQIFPDKRFAPVKAHYDSPYGLIASSWSLKGKKLSWEVTVPPGLPCQAVLPNGKVLSLNAGTHKLL